MVFSISLTEANWHRECSSTSIGSTGHPLRPHSGWLSFFLKEKHKQIWFETLLFIDNLYLTLSHEPTPKWTFRKLTLKCVYVSCWIPCALSWFLTSATGLLPWIIMLCKNYEQWDDKFIWCRSRKYIIWKKVKGSK